MIEYYTTIGVLSLILAALVVAFGTYTHMTNSRVWRVYYKREFEKLSNVDGVELGSGSHLIDGNLYYQSILMTKKTAFEYLSIFEDAAFIIKRRGINTGKRIVKG